LGSLFQSFPIVGEVQGSMPIDSANVKDHTQCATWQPMSGPCGTKKFAKNVSICQSIIRPHVLSTYFQLSSLACHLPCVSRTMPCQYVWTVQSTIFLSVWQIEQNVISPSYSVHLNPFQVCWVREDEAYVLACFEVILRTLNFEKNLIPWITRNVDCPLISLSNGI